MVDITCCNLLKTYHSELTQFPFTPKGVSGLTHWGNSCVVRMTHAPCRQVGAAGQGASVPHPRDAHMHARHTDIVF